MPRIPRPTAQTGSPPPDPVRRSRGFEPAAGLVQKRIQKAGEARGFSASRLLTHWPEVAGEDMAAVTRPVKVGYGREGLGATLTLLVAAAHAPMVQMRLPDLRARVNAVYGYNAIARIAITQTAPTGFSEGRAAFAPAPPPAPLAPDPAVARAAAETAAIVHDQGLRTALEALARNVLTRVRKQKG